jgi:hypothetical protein
LVFVGDPADQAQLQDLAMLINLKAMGKGINA